MQVNGITNTIDVKSKQNFRAAADSSQAPVVTNSIQPIPIKASEAYVSPQITQGYREVDTFDVPYVGKGKLYELANGHRVAIVKKAGPTCLKTIVKGGSEEQYNSCHLLEHLLYNGENLVENMKFSEFLSQKGIEMDAVTGGDYMAYKLQYPLGGKDDLDWLIKVQSDLLQNPKFTKEKFEKEKSVIIAEYEQNIEDTDDGSLFKFFRDMLLDSEKKSSIKPFSKNEVESISFEQLMKLHGETYQNRNMLSVVVGDVEDAAVLKSFIDHFNKPNKPAPPPETPPALIPLSKTKRVDLVWDGDYPKGIFVGFVGPKNSDIKDQLASYALKIYINNICHYADTNLALLGKDNAPQDRIGIVFEDTSKGLESDLNRLYRGLFHLKEKGFSDKTVNVIKTNIKSIYSSTAENAGDLAEIVGDACDSPNSNSFMHFYKYIDGLTAKDMNDYLEKYIDLDKALVMTVKQKKSDAKVTKPAFKGDHKKINTDNIKEYVYPSNLQLIVDTSPEVIRTAFYVRTSAVDYIPSKPSTEAILNEMFEVMVKNLKFSSVNNSKISFKIKDGEISLSASAPPELSGQAIKQVKELLLNPKFDEKTFNAVKEQRRFLFKAFSLDFGDEINKSLYTGYPYRQTGEDMLKALDDIKFSEVVDYYKKVLANSQGVAALTMPKALFDKDSTKIFDLIGKDVPALQKKQEVRWISKFSVKPLEKTKVVTQSKDEDGVRVAQIFMLPDSDEMQRKEAIILSLLEIVIGDGQNSRLFKEIRENQGIAYSMFAKNYPYKVGSNFCLWAYCPANKENTGDVKKILEAYKKTMDDLSQKPVSQEELQQAKNRHKGDMINSLQYASYRNIMDTAFSQKDRGDWFELTDSITPADIQNFIKKYFPKNSLIRVEGNKDAIEANKDYFATLGEVKNFKYSIDIEKALNGEEYRFY